MIVDYELNPVIRTPNPINILIDSGESLLGAHKNKVHCYKWTVHTGWRSISRRGGCDRALGRCATTSTRPAAATARDRCGSPGPSAAVPKVQHGAHIANAVLHRNRLSSTVSAKVEWDAPTLHR
ncbi:hypothetical protein evm_014765 [Chilo suppressalis]|nr:hypothetical protein evm_014765 [Chilo suppressalis]